MVRIVPYGLIEMLHCFLKATIKTYKRNGRSSFSHYFLYERNNCKL